MTRELMDNNPRVLSPHKPPANSVQYLIIEGLGYCCAHFFWKHYAHLPAPLIAARLGVSPDTIRRHKQQWREGDFPCARSKKCMERATSKPPHAT